jgi:hypothetical protein
MAWELWMMDKLKFRYSWMDIQAAKAKVGKRKDFIKQRLGYIRHNCLD